MTQWRGFGSPVFWAQSRLRQLEYREGLRQAWQESHVGSYFFIKGLRLRRIGRARAVRGSLRFNDKLERLAGRAGGRKRSARLAGAANG
jgi:hypothetical protein